MTSRLLFLEERKRLQRDLSSSREKRPSLIDPSTVEICDSEEVNRRLELEILKNNGNQHEQQQHNSKQLLGTASTSIAADSNSSSSNKNRDDASSLQNSVHPFALMMQQPARYIAQHWGKTVVFHIPGNLMEDNSTRSSNIDKLLGDLAMAWILGMKIVVVMGNRYDWDLCDLDASSSSSATATPSSTTSPTGSSNTLQVTSEETLRLLEEEAGYWRTEVERKLNKCLHGVSHHAGHLEGNVVSGNFYTAKRVVVGRRRGDGEDHHDDDHNYEYTGYANKIHADTIHRILHDNHDVVVLSTVGLCKDGNLINVNGYHLAAATATSLNAYKVVYMAHQGSVLQQKVPMSTSRHRDSPSSQHRVIQELPISCAKAITDYHNVRVHKQGFATFEQAQQNLPSRDIELLLHMGWATWAVERGVTRAHIVNPTDGALLEELFTSKNGANTCIFHDQELNHRQDDDDDEEEEIVWHNDDSIQDDSGASMSSSPPSFYPGPILTSPTAFAAKKNYGSNYQHQKSNNYNIKLGRNTAF
jgi:acetylglutamate kinase